MAEFHIGTAGWSYLRRDKEFYPKGVAKEGKLAFYASRFNAVELNNSFYHVPPLEQFAAWETQVPAAFRFAVKASRFITHIKKLKDAEETLPLFLDALKLQRKPGPILFQLPGTLPFDLPRLKAFLEQLPNDKRYAIELRDPSWHTEAVYALLEKHNVAFVLFDTPESISPRKLTASYAYVRLRGRDEPRLKYFLTKWRDWLNDNTKETYVFFNHQEDKRFSFGNALLFRELAESGASP